MLRTLNRCYLFPSLIHAFHALFFRFSGAACSLGSYHDWTDHDLGEALRIGRQPVRRGKGLAGRGGRRTGTKESERKARK